MNNKGFTVTEMLIITALTSFFVYSAIFMPTRLAKDYVNYQKLSEHTTELININKVVYMDLENMKIKEIDKDNLEIGDSSYSFTEEGLYREKNLSNIKLSDNKLFYKIEDSGTGTLLNIYNDDVDLKYSINNSSFHLYEKRGNANEQS